MVECTEAAVLDCLLKAVSQDQEQAMMATDVLAMFGKRLPYFRILAQLFPVPELPHSARLLALIQLKQFVHNRWLSSRAVPDPAFPLSGDERAWFRHHFLAHVCLPDDALLQQLSVVIAKVARSDWPDQWPELLPRLMGEADGPAPGPLVVLLHVVKSFASRRLPAHRQLFTRFAGEVTPLLLSGCSAAMRAFQEALEAGSGPGMGLDRIRLFVSIFRCLVEFGFRDASPCAELDALVSLHLDFVGYLLGREERLAVLGEAAAAVKVLVKTSHLLLACQASMPRRFAPHIPGVVEGLVLRWTALLDRPRSLLLTEALVRNLLNLLHALLTCPRYRPRIQRDPEEAAAAASARESLRAALRPHLDALLRHLVLSHLVLSAAEEAAVVHDFEEHVFPEETDQEWRYDLRACVHSLLLLLCTEFEEDGPRLLLALIREGVEAPGAGLEAARRREACLGVLGVVAAWVQHEIQPQQVCSHLIFPTLSQPPADAPSEEARVHDLVLRRRLLWLLGEVADETLSAPLLVTLLDCVWEYLSGGHETLLRLQAARSLTKLLGVLDECDEAAAAFDEPLLKGLPGAFSALLQLLGAGGVRECSTKIKLVQVVRACVASMRFSTARVQALRSFLPGLPAFWAAAKESEVLLRAALLDLYGDTAEALGAEAVLLLDLVTALLLVAVPAPDALDEADDTLLEPGMSLWHAFLKNARLLEVPDEAKARLVALFPRLLPLLERCNDLTLVCLSVAEALVVTTGAPFMKAFAVPLADSLRGIVQLAEPSLADSALLVVESVVKIYPADAVPLFAGLGQHLLSLLMEFGETPSEQDTELRANHVRVLARLFLADEQQFRALLVAHAGRPERAEAAVCYLLQKVHFLLVHWSSTRVRKLMAMTLCALMAAFGASLPGFVGARFEELVDCLLAAVREMEPGPDAKPAVTDSASSSCVETACAALPQAKRTVFRDDPVHACELRRWLANQLHKYRLSLGQEAFEAQVEGLDPVIRQQLLLLLTTAC